MRTAADPGVGGVCGAGGVVSCLAGTQSLLRLALDFVLLLLLLVCVAAGCQVYVLGRATVVTARPSLERVLEADQAVQQLPRISCVSVFSKQLQQQQQQASVLLQQQDQHQHQRQQQHKQQHVCSASGRLSSSSSSSSAAKDLAAVAAQWQPPSSSVCRQLG